MLRLCGQADAPVGGLSPTDGRLKVRMAMETCV